MAIVRGKVVFVGDCNVGKTSIIASYNKNSLPTGPTVAAESIAIRVDWRGIQVPLTIFDTAGQDDYRCLVPLYTRFAQVGVIVYDQTLPSSFNHIPGWINFLKSNSDIPYIILVANKVDLPSEIKAADEDQVAATHGLELIRTSAVTGQNIDILFSEIAGIVEKDVTATKTKQPPGVKKLSSSGSGAAAAPGCSC
jgi:small GTP-binding protein